MCKLRANSFLMRCFVFHSNLTSLGSVRAEVLLLFGSDTNFHTSEALYCTFTETQRETTHTEAPVDVHTHTHTHAQVSASYSRPVWDSLTLMLIQPSLTPFTWDCCPRLLSAVPETTVCNCSNIHEWKTTELHKITHNYLKTKSLQIKFSFSLSLPQSCAPLTLCLII